MKGILENLVIHCLWELANPGKGNPSRVSKALIMSEHQKYRIKGQYNMMQAQAWNMLVSLGLFSCNVVVHNEKSSCSHGYRTTTSRADLNPRQGQDLSLFATELEAESNPSQPT